MKKSLIYLFLLLIATTFVGCSKWNTNYEKAFDKAKSSDMPVLLYFDANSFAGAVFQDFREFFDCVAFAFGCFCFDSVF